MYRLRSHPMAQTHRHRGIRSLHFERDSYSSLDLAIVEGPEEAVVKKINELAAEAKEHGEQVGIIATDETKDRYPEGLVVSIGSRKEEETIAHHLYEVLRDFDQSAVRSIYSEAFYTPRMGQAIMNRLLKAAGHKIIQVV